MTIDVTHNGTHVLDESALCALIDERDVLRAENERLKEEPEWELGEAEIVKGKIDRRIAEAVAQRTRECAEEIKSTACCDPMLHAIERIKARWPEDCG